MYSNTNQAISPESLKGKYLTLRQAGTILAHPKGAPQETWFTARGISVVRILGHRFIQRHELVTYLARVQLIDESGIDTSNWPDPWDRVPSAISPYTPSIAELGLKAVR